MQEQKKIDQHLTENTWYSDDKINKILGQIKQDYTVLAASHKPNDLQDRFNYIKGAQKSIIPLNVHSVTKKLLKTETNHWVALLVKKILI